MTSESEVNVRIFKMQLSSPSQAGAFRMVIASLFR
jgi:hypothetical protein